jgi:ABC-type transport system involved in cytochrome c biogenesis permease subunit
MKRRLNWPLWAGFLLSLLAFFSYFALFVRFPVTRDFPWANLLLFALAAILLVWGLRQAFAQSALYRGKIFGPILTVLSVAVLGFFCYGMFVAARQLPSAQAAPQVGQKAPEFTLTDTNNKPVSLSELLYPAGTDPKGVLLVFYRGYW